MSFYPSKVAYKIIFAYFIIYKLELQFLARKKNIKVFNI